MFFSVFSFFPNSLRQKRWLRRRQVLPPYTQALRRRFVQSVWMTEYYALVRERAAEKNRHRLVTTCPAPQSSFKEWSVINGKIAAASKWHRHTPDFCLPSKEPNWIDSPGEGVCTLRGDKSKIGALVFWPMPKNRAAISSWLKPATAIARSSKTRGKKILKTTTKQKIHSTINPVLPQSIHSVDEWETGLDITWKWESSGEGAEVTTKVRWSGYQEPMKWPVSGFWMTMVSQGNLQTKVTRIPGENELNSFFASSHLPPLSHYPQLPVMCFFWHVTTIVVYTHSVRKESLNKTN